jgi:hypothetical protein
VTAILHPEPVDLCKEIIKELAENLEKFLKKLWRVFFYKNTEGGK